MLFLFLVLVFTVHVPAQKVVAITLEWDDDGIEGVFALPPYNFDGTYSVIIRNMKDVDMIMDTFGKLKAVEKYASIDTRGRFLIFYDNDTADCIYFSYLLIYIKSKVLEFSPSFILTLNKIVKKYNKKGFWPSTCAYYLRRQAMDKKGS